MLQVAARDVESASAVPISRRFPQALAADSPGLKAREDSIPSPGTISRRFPRRALYEAYERSIKAAEDPHARHYERAPEPAVPAPEVEARSPAELASEALEARNKLRDSRKRTPLSESASAKHARAFKSPSSNGATRKRAPDAPPNVKRRRPDVAPPMDATVRGHPVPRSPVDPPMDATVRGHPVPRSPAVDPPMDAAVRGYHGPPPPKVEARTPEPAPEPEIPAAPKRRSRKSSQKPGKGSKRAAVARAVSSPKTARAPDSAFHAKPRRHKPSQRRTNAAVADVKAREPVPAPAPVPEAAAPAAEVKARAPETPASASDVKARSPARGGGKKSHKPKSFKKPKSGSVKSRSAARSKRYNRFTRRALKARSPAPGLSPAGGPSLQARGWAEEDLYEDEDDGWYQHHHYHHHHHHDHYDDSDAPACGTDAQATGNGANVGTTCPCANAPGAAPTGTTDAPAGPTDTPGTSPSLCYCILTKSYSFSSCDGYYDRIGSYAHCLCTY